MNNPTRREFLSRAILGAVGSGIALSVFSPEDLIGLAATQRGYTAGRFALDIGGVPAGWIQSAEGGHATSDVVSEKVGRTVEKHVGGVLYEPITISCGAGMSRHFYEWITASIETARRQDGAIHSCDYDGNIISTLEFHNALVTEIGLPALDAASKDPAKMTIKLSPESTRTVTGRGKVSFFRNDAGKQKTWVSSNFRLQIAGVDCTRVNKIDAITIKQSAGAQSGGIRRSYEGEPANAGLTHLGATVEESHSADFANWMRSSNRNPNAPGNNKAGQLEFLSGDGREALLALRFANLGMRSLTPENGGMVRRVKAEMYCHGVQFIYG